MSYDGPESEKTFDPMVVIRSWFAGPGSWPLDLLWWIRR